MTAISSNISKATRVPRAAAALDVFIVEAGGVGIMEMFDYTVFQVQSSDLYTDYPRKYSLSDIGHRNL